MSNPFPPRVQRLLLILLPLLALALSACGTIQLYPEFSHQGRLLDDSGSPVPDGDYEVAYGLFHQLSGGTAVYTSTVTIPVQDGLFDTSLGLSGDINPEIFSQPTWMEVAVEGETLTPRQRLEGAPFAFSLTSGAVVQGLEPRERSFAGFDDTGSTLTVWNRDATETGGHGLLVLNQAAPTGADRSITSAFLAIAAGGDPIAGTGSYGGIIRSQAFRGMYAKGATDYFAGVFDSNVGISLVGGGTCSGCALSYPALNTGAAAIQPGDFVAVRGVTVDPDLNTPVMQVAKAAAGDTAVIGVAAGAMSRTPVDKTFGAQTGGFNYTGGAAAADSYVTVVVQGLVQARVGALAAEKLGQTLEATAAAEPAMGRLMSAPDSDGLAWVMLSGQ